MEEEQLDTLFIMALARGSVNFVRLLLFDYGVSIHTILTPSVLEFLYGYQSHEKNFPFRMGSHEYIQDDSGEEWREVSNLESWSLASGCLVDAECLKIHESLSLSMFSSL